MNYRGRQIDPLALWGRYVEFPDAARVDQHDAFAPKVVCPNPNHDTMKRHFQVNLHEPMVHCFALCGISGSYEHAISVIEGLYDKFKVEDADDDRERFRRKQRAHRAARRIILQQATGSEFLRSAHVQRKRSSNGRTGPVISPDQLRYELYLPQAALEYLSERKISSESVATWQIGWDSDALRVVIPAHDENGHLKFLIRRAVNPRQNPKYLYTDGYPKTNLLFGVDKIILGMVKSDGLILTEGSLDTIRLHQHGLRHAVAILGTGISEQQRRIIARIRPPRVILWFDKDSSGIRNIEIAASKLRKYPLYIVRYPKGKFDPAELTGREARRQLSRAVPAAKFIRENSLNVNQRKELQPYGTQQ